ncbi:Serine carboxypeptidase-like 40 [Apostasia shenzhenica]|uniref:Serine carboxypeptidase-like 40 n=1 Tax=Apostasia shenzhenica TaxID=1088818 RepID=A0A2H9ZZ09_9ASPA|nr:Serine carboxypeptidase-like 40 [Apostasia shenzhenica]
MKSLFPLFLHLLVLHAAAASPTRLLLDFVIGKVRTGAARPWDLTLLPVASVTTNQGSKVADRIAALPGEPVVRANVRQYAGYVAVDQKAGRNFFYYFVEAREKKNATNVAPLILWINGGPGCSSVGAGAFIEHGRLLVNPGGKTLRLSHHFWSKLAHVLYVDSPVGTGFSYSDTPSDYLSYSDSSVASDNLNFLVNWLARFPEHAGRDLYLAGEGYAGNYLPQLAQIILNHNRARKAPAIKLKGLIMGNPIMDFEQDRWGVFDNLWSHGMLSQGVIDTIQKECTNWTTPAGCSAITAVAGRLVAPLYLFDLTASVCRFKFTPSTKLNVEEHYECAEKDVAAYLSSPDVQKALHVNPAKAPKTWVQCNSNVMNSYGDITISTLPILESLLSNNVSIFIYRQQGGYAEEYSNGLLTYATVRGAGHLVAKTKGPELQQMLNLYFSGTLKNTVVAGM